MNGIIVLLSIYSGDDAMDLETMLIAHRAYSLTTSPIQKYNLYIYIISVVKIVMLQSNLKIHKHIYTISIVRIVILL